MHVNSEPCKSDKLNQLIPNDRTHGRSEPKTTPNQKGTGGVEEYNSEDIHLPKSKYDHGKIKIRTERKIVDSGYRLNEINSISEISKMSSIDTFTDLPNKTNTTIKGKEVSGGCRFNAEDELVIQSPTKISKFGPFKKGFKFKLNGMIIFTIGLLLNNSCCTAASSEQTVRTLGSSVQLNWFFRTDDAEIKPIIQFQNQAGSFKEHRIDGVKYELQLTRTDGQIKITFLVHDITDTDYGVYRCYLNNQPGEYKDINISLADFTWVPTTREPVNSTLRQDVELSWEYQTHKSINKISFSRQNNITNQTTDIGVWTIEKGFKQNRVDVSTELILNITQIHKRGVERISLQLQQTIIDDFDKTYYCHVVYDDHISYSQGVELVAERSTCKGKGIESDKSGTTFTWMYHYRYPIIAVKISRIDSTGKEEDYLGYWYQNKFLPEPLFKGRLVFNITEVADDRRQITLVLIDTSESDFNLTYICKVIPGDGHFCQCRLQLNDVDDLNHDNYTAPTGITKPRDKIVSSINSSPIIVVAVIIPVLVIICILTTILVVRKRQKAPIPPQCNENEPCM
ncbi:uncharacterized protein LOC126812093 isoform X5 [Patella vulgata]|nr:uncharacterized protein LOC126812093 isoform X5 [Patella vulgata]